MNVLLSLLVCVIFLSLMIGMGGIPESISQTAYITKRKVAYTICVSIAVGLLLPTLLERAHHGTTWLAFLMFIGSLFVAFTPNYKTNDTIQHNIGGFMCGISSQLYIAFNETALLLLWIPYFVYLLLFRDKNYTFWAEITCLAIIYLFCLT